MVSCMGGDVALVVAKVWTLSSSWYVTRTLGSSSSLPGRGRRWGREFYGGLQPGNGIAPRYPVRSRLLLSLDNYLREGGGTIIGEAGNNLRKPGAKTQIVGRSICLRIQGWQGWRRLNILRIRVQKEVVCCSVLTVLTCLTWLAVWRDSKSTPKLPNKAK